MIVSYYLLKSNQIHRDYVYRILRENHLRCSCCYLNRHIQYNCVGIKIPISVFQLQFWCIAGKNNGSAKQYQETLRIRQYRSNCLREIIYIALAILAHVDTMLSTARLYLMFMSVFGQMYHSSFSVFFFSDRRYCLFFLRRQLVNAITKASTASKRVMTLAPMSSPIEPPGSPVTSQVQYVKLLFPSAGIIASSKSMLLSQSEESDDFLEQKGVTVMDSGFEPNRKHVAKPETGGDTTGTILTQHGRTNSREIVRTCRINAHAGQGGCFC